MTQMTSPYRADLERLADLPAQIEAQDRMINGLRDDKRKLERRLDVTEAKIKTLPGVRSESNAELRRAQFILHCDADPNWTKLTSRSEELARTIGAHEAQRDALRRERDAIRLALEHAFADRLEKALSDQNLATAIGRGLLA